MSRFHLVGMTAGAGLLACGLVQESYRLPVALVILATFLLVFALGVSFIQWQFFCRAFCRGNGDAAQVALTFDDGPDSNATPKLLDLLRQRDCQAAFFVVGRRAEQHAELTRRIADEGHLVGNHTYDHHWWTNFLVGRALSHQVQSAQAAIERATGVAPDLIRPPMGLTNPHYPSMLRRTGLQLVGWNVRSFDRRRPAPQVLDHVMRRVGNGSVILLHDLRPDADQLLTLVGDLIDALHAAGFEIVRLDKLAGFAPLDDQD